MRKLLFVVTIACFSHTVFGAATILSEPPRPASLQLPACGDLYAPPFAEPGAAVADRSCPTPTPRSYVPRHRGLGYEILTLESEACFVPDDAFRSLDALIDQARDALASQHVKDLAWDARASAVFATIGATLVANGFQLHIPTETLGNALVERQLADNGKFIADCDTSAFIYLSLTEELSLPVHLVEIRLDSGAGHNYLRWIGDSGAFMDWDTNGRAQCATPSELPSWQGRALSRGETLGYATALRAPLWERQGKIDRALDDYRTAMAKYPSAPISHNNMAWMVATKGSIVGDEIFAEALAAAGKAVSIERSANNLDTLACMQARMGNFTAAVATQTEAIEKDPGTQEFVDRLKGFQALPTPKNCVGS